ncbi:hypothetical protein I4U23_001457 [Adineta vaga]|nr:hypothetical protein I4U23_001457 [Adineta vaga]
MKFYESFHILSYFLKNLPNLSELIIETDEIWIDGYQWEDILMNYLKQLKIFHLLMFYQINSEKNIIDEITYLIESFQTTFWLNEYQKFIRCDYHSEHGRTCLYTLPYGFRKFKSDTCNMSISTYPKEKMSKAFHSVRSVVLSSVTNEFASKTSVQLSNIQHLELYYPFDDKFWLVLTNFDRLRSLEIISIPFLSETDRHIDYVYSLIERSKYLYSLSMDYLVLEELSTMSTPIKSIRRLNLMANDGHFYGSECISLIQSCFGNQCEILFINLENRTIALDIIHQMSYLRVLIFQCQDDQWEDNQETMSTTDELLPYFKQHLSSNCSILRDEHESNIIQLWIR